MRMYVHAVRFDGKNFDEVEEFVAGDCGLVPGGCVVATRDGPLYFERGDWIQRLPDGRRFIRKRHLHPGWRPRESGEGVEP
jgi:hypothetical protein